MRLADERTVLAIVSDHGSAARTDAKTLHTIRANAIVRALGRKGELAAFAVGGRLHIRELDSSTSDAVEPPSFVRTLEEATVDGRKFFDIEKSDPPYYTVSLEPGGSTSGSVRLGENLVPVSELLTVSTFTGEHTLNGIIGLWGPPIRPGAVIEDAGLRDLAPTLLVLMGFPISSEMDGRVLREAFTDRFNTGLRIRTVESYRVSPQQRSERSEQQETEEEVEKKLRALGYLQ
jgi:hypothetical protein